jgi:RecA-family ATPase
MKNVGHAAPWAQSAQEIAHALGKPQKYRSGWKAQCPCHDDREPSLSLTDDHGTVLFICRAGCSQRDVFNALRARGFGPAPDRAKNGRAHAPAKQEWTPILPPPADAPRPTDQQLRCDQLHEYTAADDRVLFYVRREEAKDGKPKQFYPLTFGSLNGKRGWHDKAPDAPRPLYGLNRLSHAAPNAVVLLCEGEKKADAAQRMFPDMVSMSWMGGANADGTTDLSPLRSRAVILWPDADQPGREAMARIAKRLPRPRIVRTDDLPEGFDSADLERQRDDPEAWLAARLADETAEYQPHDAPALTVIDPTTLHGLPVPEMEWLVPHWIPLARVTGLYGSGGEGKTTIAQQLATAAALSDPDVKWFGLPVRRCSSLLFFCEDDLDEMWRRQQAINQHYGCTLADLGAMHWIPRLGFENTFMTFEAGRACLTEIYAELAAYAECIRPGVIFCDTIADIFGGSENDRVQARSFVQTALGGLTRQTGASVVALAHPSLTGIKSGTGSSGSTAWVGTFRSHLFLTSPKPNSAEPDSDARTLTRTKANNARRDETIDLRWRSGVFVNDGSLPGILGSIERRSCDQVFLRLLTRFTAEKRQVSHSNRAGNYAPSIMAKQPLEDRERFKRDDFEHAMERLLRDKTIIIVPCKSASRHPAECLQIAEHSI